MNESYLNSVRNTVLSSKPSIAIRLLLMVLFVSLFSNVASSQWQCGGSSGTVFSNTANMCVGGSTEQFWSNGWAGGIWSSSNPSVLTVVQNTYNGNATVTAIASGTADVIYTYRQNGCPDKTSKKTITVGSAIMGAVSADQYICSGGNLTDDITIANTTGTVQWKRADNAAFTTNVKNVGVNSTTLTIAQVGVLTSTKYFRAVVTGGACGSGTSEIITVTVSPASIVGAVSGSQTICSGSSISTNISIANATGTIQWQKADDLGFTTNLTDIGTNSITLTIAQVGVLTTTKYFRAVVKSGICATSISGTVTVTVVVPPTITPNKVDVTCASSNSGTISPVISGGLSNVRYIKLTQKYASYQQVAEIQAFEIFAGTNVALSSGGAAVTSSSDYSSDYLATEVNDGVTATNGNMWHSYSPNINEWIKIDLQSGKNIDYIKIYNRTDCCQDRGQNMLLELFDASTNLVYSKTIDLYQSGANIPVNVNVLDVSWADGATTLNRTGLSSGTYTLNYADAVGCPISSPTVINSVNATSAPTVGTKTQPTCSTATGSVVLNGLPSGSWILTQNPGGTTTTGTGTSTTISGLSSGTYTYSVVGANNGLKAEYFNSKDLSGPAVLTRTDATVSFDWGNGSPDSSINNEAFSARWSGLVQPLYSETYTFKTTSDDGVRLWVNGVKIIDNWTDHAVFDNTGTIALTAGEKYNIVLEYYENGGLAVSKLSWSSPTNPTSVIIPTTQLFSVSTCTSPASANVVIDAQPAMPVTPTVGAPTQPTCSVPTGSFAISNYNSSYTYSVSPSTGVTISGSTVTAPVGSYTVTASSGGCTSSASPSVVINAAVAKTWKGTAWLPDGIAPTKDDVVIINGDYNTSSNGDLNACSLTINSGYTLTITPLKFVVVQNDLTVDGKLDVLDKGSLVMVNDAGIVSGTGKTTIRKFTTATKKLDFVYWSTPVVSTTIATTFLGWRTDRAFEYNNDNKAWKYATAMDPAKGYIITVPNSGGIAFADFEGKVNNGVIKDKNIVASAPYLIGNPYPSAIDADAFLSENAEVIEGTIYFWTHNTAIQLASKIPGTAGSGAYAFTSDDYATYNIVGGVATGLLSGVGNLPISGGTLKPTGQIASCQGFFASSNATDRLKRNEIVFKNGMRLGSGDKSLDNTNFFRTKASKTAKTFEKNRLWLNLTNTGGAFKQLLVGYVTDATNDYESRFDGESFAGNQYIDFYSVVKDKNLTIQGRALPFDEKDEVPLGYNTTIEGPFTISLDDADGFMSNQSVFLEDKLTNTVFDLKGANYTFNTAKGTFNDRFVLKYANKTLGMEEVVEKEDGILALYTSNYQTLIIHNKGIASTVNSVTLFNMTGQKIGVWNVKDFEQTNIQIPIKDISSGIYIVKISTTNGDSSKKIVVN